MDKALYLLLGVALTWAFYFLQRRVERRALTDTIERNQKLLALKQGMEVANTSLDDLRHFEGRLIGKAEIAVRIADGYVSQAEEVARHVEAASISHDEMNQQALADFRDVDARLDGMVAHLRRQLDGESLATFDAAHLAWLGFRERYARFVAQSYSAGAIQPLIHAVTLESVTAAWIAELGTQLGDEEDD